MGQKAERILYVLNLLSIQIKQSFKKATILKKIRKSDTK
jgi:hypothetical protein